MRIAALLLSVFMVVFAGEPALAQQQQQQLSPGALTIQKLLNQGYEIKAASSNGQQQFLYLQGVNPAGQKTAYACQLEFGPTGGFQGCIALP